MTELLFNTIWVATCLAALFVWARHGCSQASFPCAVRSFALLLVVFALLFPVISITDDLQISPNLFASVAAGPQGFKKLLKLEITKTFTVVSLLAVLLFVSSNNQLRLEIWNRRYIQWSVAKLEQSFRPAIQKRPPPYFPFAV